MLSSCELCLGAAMQVVPALLCSCILWRSTVDVFQGPPPPRIKKIRLEPTRTSGSQKLQLRVTSSSVVELARARPDASRYFGQEGHVIIDVCLCVCLLARLSKTALPIFAKFGRKG